MAKKLTTTELLRRVDAGESYAEIAKDHGISRQAVFNRVRKLRGKTTKAVAVRQEKVQRVVDQRLDSIEQLTRINDYANELLDLCMRWQRGDEAALQILESQMATKRVRIGSEEIDVQEFRFKDPRELALKAMAEIRGQLRLQLEVFQALFDMKAVEEFQQEVLAAIGEASPEIRSAIINKLNQRRAIRSTVKFS